MGLPGADVKRRASPSESSEDVCCFRSDRSILTKFRTVPRGLAWRAGWCWRSFTSMSQWFAPNHLAATAPVGRGDLGSVE